MGATIFELRERLEVMARDCCLVVVRASNNF